MNTFTKLFLINATFVTMVAGNDCRYDPLAGAITTEPRQGYDSYSTGPTLQTTGGPNGIVRNAVCRRVVNGYNVECSVRVAPAMSWSCTQGTLFGTVAVTTNAAGVYGQHQLIRFYPNFIDLGLDVWDRCDGDYIDGDRVGFTSC